MIKTYYIYYIGAAVPGQWQRKERFLFPFYDKIREDKIIYGISPKEVIMNRRILVDVGMLLSFLVLLDYRLVRNTGHEALAVVFFLLFLLHTWFNRQWYVSLPRGRWNTDRKLTFLSDILLLGSFGAVMGSGLLISHTLPTGMEKAPLLAHQIHHVAGYVMVIALGFHLGLHWNAILPRLERGIGLRKIPHLSLLYKILLCLLAAGGIYFSFYYSIGSRLLLLRIPSARSMPVTLWTFTFGHLLIISLYAAGAYYVQKLLRPSKRKSSRA